MKVLLAEDNPVNQEVATELLKTLGHEVTLAENGWKAVAAWEAGEFDLIFMDVQMPEMGGLEATAEIRRRERGAPRHVPIYAMTAHALKSDRDQCLQAGMDGYISKPVSEDRIAAAIEEVARGLGVDAEGDSPPPAAAPPAGDEAPREDAPAGAAGPVNYDDLLRRCMGKREIADRVLQRFVETAPETLEQIERALATDQFELASRGAHTLKGASASISAADVSAAAASLEKSAGAGRKQQAVADLTLLKGQLTKSLGAIPRLLAAESRRA